MAAAANWNYEYPRRINDHRTAHDPTRRECCAGKGNWKWLPGTFTVYMLTVCGKRYIGIAEDVSVRMYHHKHGHYDNDPARRRTGDIGRLIAEKGWKGNVKLETVCSGIKTRTLANIFEAAAIRELRTHVSQGGLNSDDGKGHCRKGDLEYESQRAAGGPVSDKEAPAHKRFSPDGYKLPVESPF